MRRSKARTIPESASIWLITFSDIMTLLLTFFVLLVSLAVIDERNKLDVMGSVSRQFGIGVTQHSKTSPDGKLAQHDPGVLDGHFEDLQPLRDRIFDDDTKDLHFQENKYVQIFSINDEVLFVPGSTQLSPKGIVLLDKLLPYLLNIEYPLLVAGHTGVKRDEEGSTYTINFNDRSADTTWLLSYQRGLSVYRHLIGRGVPSSRLFLEAFGQFHPRFTNNTPEGRRKNRRVDIVLDKRNKEWIDKIATMNDVPPPSIQEHQVKGFRFDLTMPGEKPQRTEEANE